MNSKASALSSLFYSFLVHYIHSVVFHLFSPWCLHRGSSENINWLEDLGKQADRACTVLYKGSKSFLITNRLNQLMVGCICSMREPQDTNLLHHSPDNLIARYGEQHHAYYQMIVLRKATIIYSWSLFSNKRSVSNNNCQLLSSYQLNHLLNLVPFLKLKSRAILVISNTLILKIGSLMNGVMKWLVCGHRSTNYKMTFKNQATRAHSIMLSLSDSP